jgi:hypothetical protein
MTVSQEQIRYVYVGPYQVGDVIPVPFSYLEDVYVKLKVDGEDKEINVDYAVDGGILTILNRILTNSTVVIYRDTAHDQDADYPQEADFDSDKIETSLDKLTMIVQEHTDAIDRSLKFDVDIDTSAVDFDYKKVTVAPPEPNKGLKWDAEGQHIVNSKYDLDELGDYCKEQADRAENAADAAELSAEEAASSAAAARAQADRAQTIVDNAVDDIEEAAEHQIGRITHKGNQILAELTADGIITGKNLKDYIKAGRNIRVQKATDGTLTISCVLADSSGGGVSGEYVTTDTDQDVSGIKNFTEGIQSRTLTLQDTTDYYGTAGFIFNINPYRDIDGSDVDRPGTAYFNVYDEHRNKTMTVFDAVPYDWDGSDYKMRLSFYGDSVHVKNIESNSMPEYANREDYDEMMSGLTFNSNIKFSIPTALYDSYGDIVEGSERTDVYENIHSGNIDRYVTTEQSIEDVREELDELSDSVDTRFTDVTDDISSINTDISSINSTLAGKQDIMSAGNDYIRVANNQIFGNFNTYTETQWNALTDEQRAAIPLAFIYE